jgi:hypothetical protein
MKVFGSRYSQGCLLRRQSTGTQSVEDMVASLPRTLFTDTRLLQQVMRDKTTNDFRLGKRSIDLAVNRFSQRLRPPEYPNTLQPSGLYLFVKVDFHILPKTTTVDISESFCVTKRFQ